MKPPPRFWLGARAEKGGDSKSKSHSGRVVGGQPRSRGFETPEGEEGGKRKSNRDPSPPRREREKTLRTFPSEEPRAGGEADGRAATSSPPGLATLPPGFAATACDAKLLLCIDD